MAWHDRLTWPLAALSDLQRDVMAMRLAVLQIPARLARIERLLVDLTVEPVADPDETPAA